MKKQRFWDICAAGALGDALGYAIEFDSWAAIEQAHGPGGLQSWPLNPQGSMEASDDTQMTLFAMEALRLAFEQAAPQPPSLDLVGSLSLQAFLRWLRTQSASGPAAGDSGLASDARMFKRQAPGSACLTALASRRAGAQAINQSKGCGGAMRAAPYAILGASHGIRAVWDGACAQAALTHGHVDGWASAGAMAFILAREPSSHDELASAALEASDLALRDGAAATSAKLRQAVDLRESPMDPQTLCDVIGEGWVGEEALGVALWAALRTNSATDAIHLGANHRGDSDSTASMAGQLAACVWGLSPNERAALALADLGRLVDSTARALIGAASLK